MAEGGLDCGQYQSFLRITLAFRVQAPDVGPFLMQLFGHVPQLLVVLPSQGGTLRIGAGHDHLRKQRTKKMKAFPGGMIAGRQMRQTFLPPALIIGGPSASPVGPPTRIELTPDPTHVWTAPRIRPPGPAHHHVGGGGWASSPNRQRPPMAAPTRRKDTPDGPNHSRFGTNRENRATPHPLGAPSPTGASCEKGGDPGPPSSVDDEIHSLGHHHQHCPVLHSGIGNQMHCNQADQSGHAAASGRTESPV